MQRVLVTSRALASVLGFVAAVGVADRALRAQDGEKTVAAGVYTEAQAIRGAAVYEANCGLCHRGDMGGSTGPALRGDRFSRTFAGQDLKALFTKIATTMPGTAPASLRDDVYLDLVAHVLRENGFPAGASELGAEGLDGVRILPGRPKPPPPVGDFSYVEVVGCLTADVGNMWTLTSATDPISVPMNSATPKLPTDLGAKALGASTFRLLDAMAYKPEAHKGHRMYVRGLLIKLPTEQRMTISSMEMVAPTCAR